MIRLKQSHSPKVPIELNKKKERVEHESELEEGSIMAVRGGKYSTITFINYETPVYSRQNTGLAASKISSIKNSVVAAKDRYASPMDMLPEARIESQLEELK